MRWLGWAAGAIALGGIVLFASRPALQVRTVDAAQLAEYSGAYQWGADAFIYLEPWSEIGRGQLVAFDESGDARALYATDRDTFFTGPGLALQTPIESRVEFTRDNQGRVASFTWQRNGGVPRVARRVPIERREDVRFTNGDVQLAGTLVSPAAGTRHPAVILVHGSGPAPRDQVLPFARFLIRQGISVLAYDKRGVGSSTGDWNTASFEDLAGDVVAAFEYLKTRVDIDPAKVGLLGWSQAGWIMPIAAARARDIAFLVSVSGAGVPVAETTIDQAQNEMRGAGLKPQTIAQIVDLMQRQYRYAQTGTGWDDYVSARATLAGRLGRPPDNFPDTPDHPSWRYMRLVYFFDPAATLSQLRVPTLALFGGLDRNIVAGKNRAAWEVALERAGNPDYRLVVLARANHTMLEGKAGGNAEGPTLQRFVPEYASTVREWLVKRVQPRNR